MKQPQMILVKHDHDGYCAYHYLLMENTKGVMIDKQGRHGISYDILYGIDGRVTPGRKIGSLRSHVKDTNGISHDKLTRADYYMFLVAGSELFKADKFKAMRIS